MTAERAMGIDFNRRFVTLAARRSTAERLPDDAPGDTPRRRDSSGCFR